MQQVENEEIPHTTMGTPKADLGKRFIAALIDSIAAGILAAIPFVGGLASMAYMVTRDGLEVDFMKHRSLGKQLMKLRPVRLDGRTLDLETSIRRNWMFGLGGLASLLLDIPVLGFLMIPVAWLIALAAFGIGVVEILKVVTDPEGRRLGDTMAGTKVIEVNE